MRVVEVFGIRAQVPNNAPVILLSEVGGSRLLPVWVGEVEAGAIAWAMEGQECARPLTHDLLLAALQVAGGRAIGQVEITALVDNVFHAALVLDNDERVDCRASDAIALALRAHVPIFVADDVLDEASVVADDADDEATDMPEVDVEKFREFLDTITPEDFA